MDLLCLACPVLTEAIGVLLPEAFFIGLLDTGTKNVRMKTVPGGTKDVLSRLSRTPPLGTE